LKFGKGAGELRALVHFETTFPLFRHSDAADFCQDMALGIDESPLACDANHALAPQSSVSPLKSVESASARIEAPRNAE
jgi:hypothetical protein